MKKNTAKKKPLVYKSNEQPSKAEEPLATVVLGAGKLLTDRALLSKVTVN